MAQEPASGVDLVGPVAVIEDGHETRRGVVAAFLGGPPGGEEAVVSSRTNPRDGGQRAAGGLRTDAARKDRRRGQRGLPAKEQRPGGTPQSVLDLVEGRLLVGWSKGDDERVDGVGEIVAVADVRAAARGTAFTLCGSSPRGPTWPSKVRLAKVDRLEVNDALAGTVAPSTKDDSLLKSLEPRKVAVRPPESVAEEPGHECTSG